MGRSSYPCIRCLEHLIEHHDPADVHGVRPFTDYIGVRADVGGYLGGNDGGVKVV